MNNVLLVFSYKVRDYTAFDVIVSEFDQRDYSVHEFTDLGPEYLTIDVLPVLLEKVKEQSGQWDRLVILSNIRELIFAWYRCYNVLVNDFIYFADDQTDSFIKMDEHYIFYRYLCNFVGIEQEILQGKIYIKLDHDYFVSLMNFMIANNNYQYFEEYLSFDFYSCPKKKFRIKEYLFHGQIYRMYMGSADTIIERIAIEDKNIPFKISLFNQSLYFVKYFTMWLSRTFSELPKYEKALFDYYREQLINVEENERLKIQRDLLDYIDSGVCSFEEKVFILFFAANLGCNNELNMRYFLQTLVSDEDNLNKHYAILVNTYFYANFYGMKRIEEMYPLRRIVVDRLAKYYRGEINGKINRNTHKVAIISDYLLNSQHSPTKYLANQIKLIKEYHPDIQIKIFVEDTLLITPEEMVKPVSATYTANSPSIRYQEQHKVLFDDKYVEIYYPISNSGRKGRVQETVAEIIEYSPNVILTTSDISIVRAILYSYFPLVYLSHGEYNFATRADVYLYGKVKHKEVYTINEKYNLIDRNAVKEYFLTINLPEPQKVIHRSEFNIAGDKIVLVTVGSRLDVEMTVEFIDMICRILQQHSNAVWLVVGPKRTSYLEDRYETLILKRQIIFVAFEEDLPALYRICDVFLNPFRRGGGTAIAYAMSQGLPVVITNSPSDGLEYTGEEFAVSNNEEYACELSRLLVDQNYRKEIGAKMREKIHGFTGENSVHCLIEAFQLAEERFLMRKNLS